MVGRVLDAGLGFRGLGLGFRGSGFGFSFGGVGLPYRGTSLIKKRRLVGPYSGFEPGCGRGRQRCGGRRRSCPCFPPARRTRRRCLWGSFVNLLSKRVSTY